MKNKWGLMAGLAVLLSAPAAALVQPLLINFQGKLVNPTTNNPTTGTVGLILSLYTVASGGTNIWTETQPSVTVTNGVFSVQIGAVTPLPRDIFLGPNLYLGVQVSGDAAGEMTPRQRLIMSPYAFTANQLSDTGNARLIADTVYSTFSNAGNFTVPGGLVGSSASFVNGVNAASATFTQFVTASSATFFGAGSNTSYVLTVTSGLVVQQGTLDVNGGGGITDVYGLQAASANFTAASATWTVVSSSGLLINAGEFQLGSSGARVMYDSPANASTNFSSNVAIVGNVSASNIAEVFLGSATLSAAAATLTVNIPSGFTFFRFEIVFPSVSAATIVQYRLNGDTAGNYNNETAQNGAAATAGLNATSAPIGTATNANPGYCTVRGGGYLSMVKSFSNFCSRGAAGANLWVQGATTWNNTAASLTSFQLLNSAAANFGIGTTIRAYGSQ